jgi:HK97 family phage prohead protease
MKYFDVALKTKALDQPGWFEGYASTFGNVDQGGDVVMRGAFLQALTDSKEQDRIIPMLWQHDTSEPIGVWHEMAEDRTGLKVLGELLIDTDPLAKRTYGLIQKKAIGGMSIGYRIPIGGAAPDPKRRGVAQLKTLDLREISLVTMPMNIEARVTAVKEAIEGGDMLSVRQFEEFLRDAGFSKSQAAAMASACKPHLRGEPEEKADDAVRFLSRMLAAQS